MSEVVVLTKQEAGCIAYDLYELSDGSGGCFMIEVWESKEALDSHFETDHFKKFGANSKNYLDAPADIKVFSKL